ncbi:DUF1822 family protein [Microcoleus sp. B9-D4]|uniref:DUF1822 family protein n=1 Tax=Microcoleus sp. B9-D4 TaxID=2818711 RepID=UPI002FD6E368
MQSTNPTLLTVPLGTDAHRTARQFAAETLQLAPELTKHEAAKRVYVNTLAVYVVYSYLKWQAYEPDLIQGDSWHPVVRAQWDIADLVLPGIGKLECRPVWFGESAIVVPPAAREDRIGYVIVEFGEKLDSGKLLGFTPSLDNSALPSQIQIAQLQNLDALIDHLYRLELGNQFLRSDDPVAIEVRQLLETQNFSEITAQLERIYRTTKPIKWRYAGADVLVASIPINPHHQILEYSPEQQALSGEIGREQKVISADFHLQQLAQKMLNKLAGIWDVETKS